MSWLDDRSVHQILVTASPGDAVTNAACQIRSLLRRHGTSEIFAFNIHGDLLGDVLPTSEYSDFAPSDPDPVTLVHVSMGDDRLLPFLDGVPGRFILSYHNVTPSHFFAPWDPAMARLLEQGRRSLELLRDRTVLALADSSFNAADLHRVGYRSVRVGGLILGLERLLDVAPTPLPGPIDGPVVLSVGQLYPHKRADLMVAAFHQLVTRHRPDAHLVLAGSNRLPPFSAALGRFVDRLGLGPRVTITGHLDDAELVAWFRRADVFVLASEHEGFCIPLVEAMLFDVPIVARANAAIPETVGDAAVLVPGDAGPGAFAAVVAEVLDDEPARRALIARGRQRRAAFSSEACCLRFLAAVDDASDPAVACR